MEADELLKTKTHLGTRPEHEMVSRSHNHLTSHFSPPISLPLENWRNKVVSGDERGSESANKTIPGRRYIIYEACWENQRMALWPSGMDEEIKELLRPEKWSVC